MSNITGKYKLELSFPGDGRALLNYWDAIHGNDVTAQIIDAKLFHEGKEITFDDFFEMVKDSIQQR